jgi:GTP pyrophosphokinase
MRNLDSLKSEILSKSVDYGYDDKKISEALAFAEFLHKDHFRKSGEPYIIHPIEVALKILDLKIGQEAVIAAILHDTLEDTEITYEEIKSKYGEEVAFLVQGVTKIASITENSLNRYPELDNLRRFVIASSKDIRVILIKLADRLHNMQTISALKPERQITYSDETLKVYVPLAEYIGVGKWKREIEDIAFKTKSPQIYEQLNKLIRNDARIHAKLNDYFINDIQKLLKKFNINYSKIYGRVKSAYSLHKKILRKAESEELEISKFDISKIRDLIGNSILIDGDAIECYKALGVIHGNFSFSEKDFSDYIAKPKPNGYRSIHTIVEYKGRTCEIQIKTLEMHEVNEFGPASHIAYKISGRKNAPSTNKFNWVKNLTLWKDNEDKNRNKFELNIFDNRVFALTPKGKIIELEKGSTPIDFAYAIHSQIGNNFTGVKINDSIAKANTIIKNGDIVEILTSKQDKNPSLEWLNFAKQNSTKSKIKKITTQLEKELLIEKGKNDLSNYLKDKIKIDWLTLDSPTISKLIKKLEVETIDNFYTFVANESLQKKKVMQALIEILNIDTNELTRPKPKKEVSENNFHQKVSICGINDLDFKIAGCCNPTSKDHIVGIITLRDGLKIHKRNCKKLIDFPENRLLDAKWD